MATSGSKTVKVTDWDSLVFSWSAPVSNQSVANNSTIVSWWLKLVSTAYGKIESTAAKDWSVTVNGKTYSGSNTVSIGNNATKTLASGTTTVVHNADGSKSFNYSFSQEFAITFSGSQIGTISGSGSGTLETIPRASQPSCITWPEHTQNVGDFGTEIAIHMNRNSSAFTHTVRYAFGSRTGTIATNVGTGTTWVIPLTLMSLIPSTIKGSGTIYVDTYNGSTFIGTKSCGFTATVPASVKPALSWVLEDTTGVDEIYGNPVQGLSRINVKLTATPAYSSPIQSYQINANGARYYAAEATTALLNTAGSSVISATVTDARRRSTTISYTMSVLAYTAPVISALTVHRCDQDGTENPRGEYVRAVFSAAVTSLGAKNTATYKLRYKKTTASSYTAVTLTALANNYAPTNYGYIFKADGSSSYDVEIEVADRHETTTRHTTASTAATLANVNADGTALALGKVSEESGTFEVALKNHFYDTTIQEGGRYAFSSPGVAGTSGFVLMAQIAIKAANADVPLTFIFNRRQVVAPMTVHLRLSNSTATASSLSSIRYEGANYGAYAYKVDELTWNLYVEKGSQWDNITLVDWYTTNTMDDRVAVTFPGELVSTVPTPYHRATPAVLDSIIDCLLPVGTIIQRYDHADPNTMYPGTTWVRLSGGFLWASQAGDTMGQTGGAKEVTLTVNQIPAHSHGSVYSQHADGTKDKAWYTTAGSSLAYGTVTAGGGQAHNNMPPYIQVSAWRRTA